ncbi:hypothetical protein Skr01_37890 [Sphaerisporangium krabiense]|uniref:DUF4232 domain-containing protein n=1 Tax=Sphaerisporangium krabiense TaxID=763782 RepID=A0A7W9DPW4_9ACTN|nr:hypothetical protein [Sphaerisporangium krabiense]MBB5626783.1 hypothetical protein [Sphaerisporangium krabiense]GII63704.1 hypothetical protein Skr01_37890 [Sphaerisporangium krabiense]
MDPDTFRGDVGVEGPEVYWRRRVSVLTGALVVVAVVAWACTSASSGSGSDARRRHDGAVPKGGPAGVTATPSPSVTAAPPAKAAAPPHPSATPAPTRVPRPGDPCERADLVLSLHGESEVYTGKGAPAFMLTLVNTGRVDCAVDVGPRAMEVRITSGDDRVWSTADCLSGERKEMRRLRRGVPHLRAIRWDRHRSAPDCHAARPKARPGTYVAQARLGVLRSPKVVFHLRRA